MGGYSHDINPKTPHVVPAAPTHNGLGEYTSRSDSSHHRDDRHCNEAARKGPLKRSSWLTKGRGSEIVASEKRCEGQRQVEWKEVWPQQRPGQRDRQHQRPYAKRASRSTRRKIDLTMDRPSKLRTRKRQAGQARKRSHDGTAAKGIGGSSRMDGHKEIAQSEPRERIRTSGLSASVKVRRNCL